MKASSLRLLTRGLACLLILVSFMSVLSSCQQSAIGSNRAFRIQNETTLDSQNFSLSKEHLSVFRFLVGCEQLNQLYYTLYMYYYMNLSSTVAPLDPYENVFTSESSYISQADPYGTFMSYTFQSRMQYVLDHINELSPRGQFDEEAHTRACYVLSACEDARAKGLYDAYDAQTAMDVENTILSYKQTADELDISFQQFIRRYMGKTVTEEHLRTVLSLNSIYTRHSEQLLDDLATNATLPNLEAFRDAHKETYYVSTYISVTLPDQSTYDAVKHCKTLQEAAEVLASRYFDSYFSKRYQDYFVAANISDDCAEQTKEDIRATVYALLGVSGYAEVFTEEDLTSSDAYRRAARRTAKAIATSNLSLRSSIEKITRRENAETLELPYVDTTKDPSALNYGSKLKKWLLAPERQTDDFFVTEETTTSYPYNSTTPEYSVIVPSLEPSGWGDGSTQIQIGGTIQPGNSSQGEVTMKTTYTLYIARQLATWQTSDSMDTLYDLYYVNLADDPTDSQADFLPEDPISGKEKADIFLQELKDIRDPQKFAEVYAKLVDRYQLNARNSASEKLSARNLLDHASVAAWLTDPARAAQDMAILPLPTDNTAKTKNGSDNVLVSDPILASEENSMYTYVFPSDVISNPIYKVESITPPFLSGGIINSSPIRYPKSDIYFVYLAKIYDEPRWLVELRDDYAEAQFNGHLDMLGNRAAVALHADPHFKASMPHDDSWVLWTLTALLIAGTVAVLILLIKTERKRRANLLSQPVLKYKRLLVVMSWCAFLGNLVGLLGFCIRSLHSHITTNSFLFFPLSALLQLMPAFLVITAGVLLLFFYLYSDHEKSSRILAGAWSALIASLAFTQIEYWTAVVTSMISDNTQDDFMFIELVLFLLNAILTALMIPTVCGVLKKKLKPVWLWIAAIVAACPATFSFLTFLRTLKYMRISSAVSLFLEFLSSLALILALWLASKPYNGFQKKGYDATTSATEDAADGSADAPAQSAPTHSTSQPDDRLISLSTEQALRFIQNQRDIGIITEEEFNDKKAQILNKK